MLGFTPLRIGDVMTRTSTIREVVEKETGAGLMALTTVDHIILGLRSHHFGERQDIAYLDILKTYSPRKSVRPKHGRFSS